MLSGPDAGKASGPDNIPLPAILKVIDPNQYGTIPNSSTTIALINMLHHWFLGTDGNG